jgi:hypothetical protein
MAGHGDLMEDSVSSTRNRGKQLVTMTNETITASVTLINAILEQITIHDAPAQNENDVSTRDSHFKHTYQELQTPHSARFLLKSPYHFGIAHAKTKWTPSSVVSTKITVGSFETDNTEYLENNNSSRTKGSTITRQYNNNQNDMSADSTTRCMAATACLEKVETQKMGHVELASLCRKSLDKLKRDIDVLPFVKVDLNLNTTPDDLDQEIPQQYNSYFDTQFKLSNVKKFKKQNSRMKRLDLRRLKRAKQAHFTDSSFPRPPMEVEEKKDDSSSGVVRLQLFGSEYARYLSTSQLAPILPSPKEGPQLRCTSRRVENSEHKSTTGARPILLLEDASDDIKNGALLDIVVTEDDMPPPQGYYRISQTSSGKRFCLAKNSNGRKVSYLYVKKEPLWDKGK